MSKFDYVIFDFDGTVADTGEGILKSLEYSFVQMNHEIPDLADMRKFIGPPIHYSFTHFYGVSEEEVGEYIRHFRARYREKGIFECCLYDGVEETIKRLRENGIKIGIASSKPLSLIYAVMKTLGVTELFDAVVGPDLDDSNHSGKTELVRSSMEKLGASDNSRVLMVGDRYFDIDGARGAGVSSAAVLYGYGSREEFDEHGADYIVKSAYEIADIAL